MSLRVRALRAGAGGVLILASACAGESALDREVATMRGQAAAAREVGAYTCAPRELAIAETQLEFIDLENELGHASHALDHRDNAKAALRKIIQAEKKCRAESDRDGDGVLDTVDRCPDVPGKVELYGCPDRDGDGVPDQLDKCPDVPGPAPTGCPGDRDGDGVLDNEDRCPEVPGPKENQGCPPVVTDRDGDGIPDDKDKCPDAPETFNGFQDDDGCPDVNPDLVVVNREIGKIEIKQKIFFNFGKATIQPKSFPLLNEVALALKQNETMEVLVEGHTDSVGSDAFNLKLSQARADSVREYLVGQGVPEGRLKATGFGETRPLESNAKAEGREKNRRVEFTITKQ